MEGRSFMSHDPNPSARSACTLPAQPNLDHLRNEAKQRLKVLRQRQPDKRLADAQLAVARDYGFASWRALKAHVDANVRERVFAAAHTGDVAAVRRAFEAGFAPDTRDAHGRTLLQIAKAEGLE